MNKYHQSVIDYFGKDWFEEGWKKFCEIRSKHPKGSFAQEILELELNLHPLQKEIFRWQGPSYAGDLDFSKIPLGGASDFIFSHLGRDLELLKEEIKMRGHSIKRDLLIAENYEGNRFVLLVAAGYKLLGYEVEFLPMDPHFKTPDLLVKMDQQKYLIECKQRNQEIADKDEYLFFGKLAETFLPLLRMRQKQDILIDVQIFMPSNPQIKKEIEIEINKQIWRNQKSKDFSKFRVGIFKASSSPGLIDLLQSSGHFQNVPVFTRTEDMYIASDPLSKNVIAMNKRVKEEKIPSNTYEELFDANKHNKGSKKLIVYYDFGRGFTAWADNLGKQTFNEYKDVEKKLGNIDLFVFLQTLLKYKGMSTEVRPTFNFIGNKEKMEGTPDQLNLFGMQGHTGMDSYIIPGFVKPIEP
jgi:hypothetical protein